MTNIGRLILLAALASLALLSSWAGPAGAQATVTVNFLPAGQGDARDGCAAWPAPAQGITKNRH